MSNWINTNDGSLLINGECLEVMEQLINMGVKVDAVICDPPYGMQFQSNIRTIKHKPILNDNNLEWLSDFVSNAYNILNDDCGMFVFTSYHNVDIFKQEIEKHFKIKNILIWVKNNAGMGDLKGQFAPKYEMVIYAVKGRVILNGHRDSDILEYKKTRNVFHPTEKPVDLMSYLTSKISVPNGVVLDPFMGSGSTGVACVQSGRRFIGIELDNDYFNTSIGRLNGASKL